MKKIITYGPFVIIGFVLGITVADYTLTPPPPEVREVEVKVEVPVPVTPFACRQAINHANKLLGASSDFMSSMNDTLAAISAEDQFEYKLALGGMEDASSEVDRWADRFTEASTECQAAE